MNFKLFVESKIWLGEIDSNGAVRAQKIDSGNQLYGTITHVDLGMEQGEESRWRYIEGSPTIYWWEVPGPYERFAVESYLDKRGFKGPFTHKRISSPEVANLSHGSDYPDDYWEEK